MAAAAEPEEESIPMEYRLLGGTALKVSAFGFGFWATYGAKDDLMDFDGSVKKAADVMRIVRNNGVNFFDNAEVYGKPRGYAERIMGAALKQLQTEEPLLWRRSELVISTKIFWGGDGRNEKGLSRKHILEGTRQSLARLRLDYADILFCHRPDDVAPTREICQAFNDLIRDGLCFYWGTSEWSAQRITEAYWISAMNGWTPPCVEQPQYNMFCRERFEKEYRRLYAAPYRMATTTWSPLKSGILTGKYNDGIPEGSRLAEMKWLSEMFDEEKEDLVPKLTTLAAFAAEKYDSSLACLAIAWVLKNKNVSTVLLGATKTEQIQENLKALAVARKMTAAEYHQINDILNNNPEPVKLWGREEPDEAKIETI